jgi:hypothetical protein
MARISTYALDAKPEINDKVIGTDNGIGEAQRTKNYSLREVMALFNERNLVAVADQVIFKFQDDITEGREPGTISLENGGGNADPISDMFDLIVSTKNSGDILIADYIKTFLSKDLIIAEMGNINNFATCKLVDLDSNFAPGFYKFSFFMNESNGFINKEKHYIIGEFSGQGDKFFEYPQSNASAFWEIEHNLNKKPSVTVSTAFSDEEVVGKVTYIDNNNLTITFNAAFSGKAYLN